MKFKQWYEQVKNTRWLRVYNNQSLRNKVLVKKSIKNEL